MAAKLIPADREGIAEAARALRAGQVVGMPTETVYGLAGDAFNPEALARIFEAKERPTFDPLIVHVAFDQGVSIVDALVAHGLVDPSRLTEAARARATRLAEAFWPGPLTMLFPKAPGVPDLATSGLASVGIRAPRHPAARALIREAGRPLAAPSANRFGRISPTEASHVEAELGDRIGWIIDGGPCEVGLESTVLQLEPLALLRPGGVPQAEIEHVLGEPVARLAPGAALGSEAQAAPGMLASHYAPRKPLHLFPARLLRLAPHERAAVLAIPGVAEARGLGLVLLAGDPDVEAAWLGTLTGKRVFARALSDRGDLAEAAHALFAELRALDAHPGVDVILAEPCDDEAGLGHAIGDRLRRAAAKRKR